MLKAPREEIVQGRNHLGKLLRGIGQKGGSAKPRVVHHKRRTEKEKEKSPSCLMHDNGVNNFLFYSPRSVDLLSVYIFPPSGNRTKRDHKASIWRRKDTYLVSSSFLRCLGSRQIAFCPMSTNPRTNFTHLHRQKGGHENLAADTLMGIGPKRRAKPQVLHHKKDL